ncbi:MAG: 3-deoxy-D-manno-octulosonate 8-phosphate phosphatase [Legionellales bacterium RIFCSPHIGHO2_12_FULL_35_11]|nr:MAG: 3-deoxy-D-manno-octulosonate 8-phosphate phosphatase [Legionellales bacterium RIFCSPHIGHO2_12_FULL_35_11]
MKELEEKAKKIKCVICDLDGVLTNGNIFIDNDNNELKSFNIQDGLGLRLLLSAGIEVAIITGSVNKVVDIRMKQLKINHYFKGQINKKNAYLELKSRLNLTDDEFAYIGDDLPDLEIMQEVGLSVAVANAVKEVKARSFWNTEYAGGQGAVREVCDYILAVQGKSEIALERYLA